MNAKLGWGKPVQLQRDGEAWQRAPGCSKGQAAALDVLAVPADANVEIDRALGRLSGLHTPFERAPSRRRSAKGNPTTDELRYPLLPQRMRTDSVGGVRAMNSARVAVRSSSLSREKRSDHGRARNPSDGTGNQSLQRALRRDARTSFTLDARNDSSEREASRAAASFAPGAGPRDRGSPTTSGGAGPSAIANAVGEPGAPLDGAVRADMEAHFGVPLGDVRVHAGPKADGLAASLGARAFTHGRDIVFGEGRKPGSDALTAHELAHVVQQTGGSGGGAGPSLSPRSEPRLIQPSFAASYPVPSGVFEVDLQTVNGGGATPPTKSGLSGTIRFVPGRGAPNSNVIAFNQIVRIVDQGGADVSPSTMGVQQAPRGPLGSPGLRTEDDPSREVEGGFETDVLHQPPPRPRARRLLPPRRARPCRPAIRPAQASRFRLRASSDRTIPPTSGRRKCWISRGRRAGTSISPSSRSRSARTR